MTRLVTFGETMASLRGSGPLRQGGPLDLSIAGSESNVAIGVARLGHSVQWVGLVGDDELGALVVRTLRAENVDTTAVDIDPQRPTGMLLLEHRIADTIRVHYYRTGSAGGAITAAAVLPVLEDGGTLLHVTGVTAALGDGATQAVTSAIGRASELGLLVSLDVNYRTRLWPIDMARATLRPLVGSLDLLFASEDELALVAADPDEPVETSAKRLVVEDGVGTVVVKRGAAGATAYTSEGAIAMPARHVPAVDVVGAGDAFVAGYLSATMDGLDTEACLDRAVALGAFCVAHSGDWEGLPTRAELGLLDLGEGITIR